MEAIFAITCSSQEMLTWTDRQLLPCAVRVHHLLLKVRDMQAAASFYLDLLGLTVRPDAKPLTDGRPFISTSQGLGITVGGSGECTQLDHLAFQVRNVRELAARLKRAGVGVVRELGPGPYGLAIYVKDPDGNTVELFEVAEVHG